MVIDVCYYPRNFTDNNRTTNLSSFLSNFKFKKNYLIDTLDSIITVVKILAKLVELNQLHLTLILTSFSPPKPFLTTSV